MRTSTVARVSQWYTGAGDLLAGWPHLGQNTRKDQVSLLAQEANTFSAHPLPMKLSVRGVGFIRPGSNITAASKFTLNSLTFIAPLDFFGLPDGSALGDEVYSGPLGIG